MHRLFPSLVILFLCLAFACNLAQAADRAGVVSVQWENDKFGGTDRNFTNGLQATYLTGEDGVSWWTRELAHSLPIIDGSGKLRSGWTIGQSIFTPENLEARQLVGNDRPYAGWLYGGYALLSDTGKELETVAVDVGLIGPYAFGEPVQNNVHRLINVQQALGWDKQLRTEPGLVLTYERKWRSLFPATYLTDDFGFDVMPHIGVSLGNVFTHAAAGGVLRFGENLPSDYGPPRIRPSLPGSSFFLPPDNGIGWYFFVGAEGRYVLRNIFLDGNSFRDSHSVDRRDFVGDLQAGVAITFEHFRFAYTQVYRTKEFDEQNGADSFGAFTLSVRF